MPTIEDDPDWKDAYLQVGVHWFDCSVGFDCVCGKPGLLIYAGDERTCDQCGRVYWLGVHFKMKELTA